VWRDPYYAEFGTQIGYLNKAKVTIMRGRHLPKYIFFFPSSIEAKKERKKAQGPMHPTLTK
jgi:hypothetical protein